MYIPMRNIDIRVFVYICIYTYIYIYIYIYKTPPPPVWPTATQRGGTTHIYMHIFVFRLKLINSSNTDGFNNS